MDQVPESTSSNQETQEGLSQSEDQSLSQDFLLRETVALKQGRGGILGIKAGMTQIYDDSGRCLAVTVIDLKPAVITQIKTVSKEGYAAVQVGLLPKKKKRTTRCEQGHVRSSGGFGFYHYCEFRLPEQASLQDLKVGHVLSPEFLQDGDWVDLSALSKGKGFQGGMKRYHMAGGMKSHGASLSHRQLGSIGNRADPAKCFKNKKMAGQMGNVRVTIQHVRVVKVDLENHFLLVHGSVPGPKSGLVEIRRTVKQVR